jgi:hypothetical protein
MNTIVFNNGDEFECIDVNSDSSKKLVIRIKSDNSNLNGIYECLTNSEASNKISYYINNDLKSIYTNYTVIQSINTSFGTIYNGDGTSSNSTTIILSKDLSLEVNITNLTEQVEEQTTKSEQISQQIQILNDIVNPTYDLEKMTVDELQTYNACQSIIAAGSDVELSIGTKHFSFKTEDQANIKSLFDTVVATNLSAKVPYHADGEVCQEFDPKDIATLYFSMQSLITYHTTYCNLMHIMINETTEASKLRAITYGDSLRDDLEVKMNDILMGAANVIGTIQASILGGDTSATESEKNS